MRFASASRCSSRNRTCAWPDLVDTFCSSSRLFCSDSRAPRPPRIRAACLAGCAGSPRRSAAAYRAPAPALAATIGCRGPYRDDRSASFLVSSAYWRAQPRDDVRRQRLGKRPASAPRFGNLLSLIVLGARFGGLDARLDQLVVEVGDLLVVDRYALRGDEVVGGSEIRTAFSADEHAGSQPFDLAIEPTGRDLRRIVFGADLLDEICLRDRIRDPRRLGRVPRIDVDVGQKRGRCRTTLRRFCRNSTERDLAVASALAPVSGFAPRTTS